MLRLLRPALLFALATSLPLAALSPARAEPTIKNVSPRGLQIGATTTLTLDGADLGPDTRLLLPDGVKIASQSLKPGATPQKVQIDVALDDSVQPGIYPLRVVSGKGVSTLVPIGIDRLPQVPFADKLPPTPVALHGAIGGGQILKTTFTAKAGSKWVFDIEAQRLGAGLKPIIRLYDHRGTQLAWSPPRRQIDGDARIEYTFTADGQYSLEIHDRLYRGGNPPHFRLKIGQLQFADMAYPLAVAIGTKTPVKFIGSNVAESAEQDATTITSKLPAPTPPLYQPAQTPASAKLLTGAAPSLLLSEHAEVTETAPATGQPLQTLAAAPIGVSGTLLAPGEEDKYALPVTPGQKLRIEVFAQRLGSPLDGVLSVRNAQGNQLAASDDRPGTTDPGLEFTVPANVKQLQLALKDLETRGGDEFVYRLAVDDMARPDFSLSLETDRLNIPAGGTIVVPVNATRTGYNGPIDLTFHGLPADVQVSGNRINTGATIGLVTLTAPGGAGQAGLVTVVGRTAEGQTPVARLATFGEVPGSRAQPYLRQQLGFAVTEPAPINLVWAPGSNELVQSGKLPVALTLTRKEGVAGAVRLRLVTSQPMPKKTIKENNKDKQVDDLDRALRLEGTPQFTGDQKELTAQVLVPADLPKQAWDLVVAADLLAADGKTVLTTVATPARTFQVASPLALDVTAPGELEAKAGTGEAGTLTGKVTRAAGFARPVVVTLEGLPKDIVPPSVFLPADKSDFALPLKFPFDTKPAQLKNAKLVAVVAPASALSVRTNSVPVKIKLTPGEKPSLDPPLEIFEDDEAFVSLLNQGKGQVRVEAVNRYSGKAALRVGGQQKFNPNLPKLGVKIRENPGPGEYRYLTFAWRKQGGASICLQLNHDGKFGPGGSGRQGAKFRYHAGPGPEPFGGSVLVDSKLPAAYALVTRDLFADFGEFTLNGLAFSALDGQAAMFDHIYLARTPEQFDLALEKNGK